MLDSSFISIERKDMPAILPVGGLFKYDYSSMTIADEFRPEKSSKFLFVTLDKLKQLGDGEYLLTHRPRDFNVVLYKAVPFSESQVIGLPFYYY